MIYLQLNTNQIKILYVKKTLLGQYEIVFYEKKYQMNFLKNGQLINPDLTASALKEALTLISNQKINDRDITLILPQESFEFIRADVPNDMAPNVIGSYIKEKARAQLSVDIDNCYYDQLILESDNQRKLTFYALDNDMLMKFQEPFNLIDLRVKAVIPETLAYFKLFEKTLRKEKKENIFYVNYDGNSASGYIYDSFGLLELDQWEKTLKEKDTIETVLKAKAVELEKKGIKLNRLIMSGVESENIRQDTFTKNVGVWTNPLKRIMPHFYADYLKMFTAQGGKAVPYLQFDACIGAFILATENKDFNLFKRKLNDYSAKTYKTGVSSNRNFSFPIRPVLLFLLAFGISLGALYGLSKLQLPGFSALSFSAPKIAVSNPFVKPTETPTPTAIPTATPTPEPEIDRTEINIKVLNGGGVKGQATVVKNILSDAGYENILTGNADNFDYEKTEIRVKEDGASLFKLVAEDLSDNVTVTKSSTLDEEEASDVIVVIGSDFK